MSDLKLQGEVSLDTSKADSAFARVGTGAKSMADGVRKSAADAGAAVSRIGDGSAASAQKVDRDTKSMISQIKRLTAETEAGSKSSTAYFEALARQRGVSVDALRPYLQQLDAARSKQDAATGSLSRFGSLLGSIAPVLAGAFSARSFVQAADAITTLNNQLRLATGSAAEAGQAYTALFEIAQRSRSSFTELGSTFASISRASEGLGLSQQQLLKLTEAIGNAVAISGSSAQASSAALVQLSQGLASGVLRGEELNSIMEQTPRLARAIADGLGVPIGKLREMGKEGELSAQTVINALQSQSNVLAGEVQTSVLTLGQAFTQLTNSATGLAGEIDRVSGSTNTMAQVMSSASGSLDRISQAMRGVEGSGLDLASVIGDGIATTFETVAALGANVAYVLTQVGKELGGLAAQAAAVAQLDFEAAGAIRRMRIEDADRDRREVDALTARIVNARTEAAKLRASLSGVDTRAEDARLARLAGETTLRPGSTTKAKTPKSKTARDEFGDVFNRVSMRDVGLDPAFYKDLNTLYDGYQKGRISIDQYREAVESLVSVQRFAVEAQKDQTAAAIASAQASNAAFDAEFESIEKKRLSVEAQIRTGREMLEQIQFETSLLGMNTAQREQAIAMRELERAGLVAGTQAYEAYSQQIKSAIINREQQQASIDAAKAAANEWQKTSDNIERSLTDALMRGFENGKSFGENLGDSISNYFKTTVAEAIASAITKAIMSALASQQWGQVISGVFGGGGGGMDWTSLATKVYEYYAGSGAASTAAVSAGAGTVNTTTLSGVSAASSGYTGVAGGSAAAGTGTASSTMTSGGFTGYGWMGYAALIAAAVMVAENLYAKGYTRAALGKGDGEANRFGYTNFQSDPNMGNSTAYNISPENRSRMIFDSLGMNEKWADILSGSVRMATLFGRKLGAYGYEAQIAGGDSEVSGFARYKGGLFRSNKTVGVEIDQRDAANVDAIVESTIEGARGMARAMGLSEEAINSYTGSIKVNMKGAETAEEQSKRMAEAMDELQFSLLKAAAGGKYSKAEFEKMMEGVRQSMEKVGITTQGIADIILAGMTGRLSEADVGAQLSEVIVGGIYNSIASNYAGMIAQAFTSQIITPIFTALAAGVPISQAISQAAIANVVATAQAAAQALNAIFSSAEFMGAINGVQSAISGVTGAVGSVKAPQFRAPSFKPVDNTAREREQLELELLRLQGNTVELRKRELAALKPVNRALQEQIWALEDINELKDAWTGLTDSIEEEIKRLRGLALGEGNQALAYVEAQYLIASGQARAMDQDAAAKLPELSSQLAELYLNTAGSRSEYQARINNLAASLEETNRITRATAGITDEGAQKVKDEALAQQVKLLQQSIEVLTARMEENNKAANITAAALNKASTPAGLRTVSA